MKIEKKTIYNLSLDEFRTICNVITYDKIEQFMRSNNESDFEHVSISHERMQRYLYFGRKDKEISGFLKNEIDMTICQIMNNSKELPTHDVSSLLEILNRLFNSNFKHNPIVFFKLIDSNYSTLYIQLLKAIDSALWDKASNEKLDYYKNQIKDAKEKLEKFDEEYIEKFHSFKNKYDDYTFEIEALQKNESIQLYDKTNTKNNVRDDFFSRDYNYTYTSICKVTRIPDKKTDGYRPALKRLADIADDGIIVPFMSVKNFTGDTKDRDIIYYTEGPDTVDTIGIWNWKASPHRYDPQKIHIDSSFSGVLPVEIIISQSSSDIEALIDEIEDGIEINNPSLPCLYSVFVDKNTIFGILLSYKKCSYNSGLLNIKDETDLLNVFLLNKDEIVSIEDKYFYRSMNLKAPIAYYRRKPIIEIVKDKIISRATWSEFKRRDITSREWSALKSFLTELPTFDLLNVIADDCKCSVEEASEYYSQFVEQCDKYIDGDTIEDDLFTTLLYNHPVLMERCSEIASEKWKEQNEALISEANQTVLDLTTQIENYKNSISDAENLLSERKEEVSKYDALLADKQKMAEEVEKNIADKINKARANAAEFISEMAFVSSAPTLNNSVSGNKMRFTVGSAIEEDVEEYSTYGMLLDILAGNLDSAGVLDVGDLQIELAAFLYSAYTERIPLLLAGPYGSQIADAVSAAILGRTAAQIDCAGNVDDYDFTSITENSDSIIVFKNALNGDWLNKIIDFAKKNETDKYCILTTPFSEDLAIEPKGILNYVIPFFTELIIAQKGDYQFYGGIPSEDFDVYSSADTKKYSHELLSEIGLGIYTRNVLKQLLSDVSDLIERKPTIDAILYYTLAYITGKLDHFADYVHDKVSDREIKTILKEYLGE